MNPDTSNRIKLLFLCTGNSARSILAEYILKKIAPQRFEVFSAGSNPKSAPNPLAIRTLRDNFKIDASDARSKSWTEFKDVHFDFVITLCDDAKESCPIWPGQPIIAHWGMEDPSNIDGTEEEELRGFFVASQLIQRRLELLASLPFGKLDALRIDAATKEIGMRK